MCWWFKNDVPVVFVSDIDIAAIAERDKRYAAEIEQKIIDYKAANPIKHNPKDTFFHWVVVKGKQEIKRYTAYGHDNHIDSMENIYTIVNFNTGEIKEVKECFIDDLKNATA